MDDETKRLVTRLREVVTSDSPIYVKAVVALADELESETRWAKEYHDKWQEALVEIDRLREACELLVKHDTLYKAKADLYETDRALEEAIVKARAALHPEQP